MRPSGFGMAIRGHSGAGEGDRARGQDDRDHRGEAFKRLAQPILDAIGPYPHAELHAMTNGRKKQVARLIKCECGRCGYVARVARQWIDDQGAPHCPAHGKMNAA